MTKRWIHKAINPKHKGELREKLHVKKGHTIPLSKLKKAAKSKNATLRKEAVLAETLRKVQHRKRTHAHK